MAHLIQWYSICNRSFSAPPISPRIPLPSLCMCFHFQQPTLASLDQKAVHTECTWIFLYLMGNPKPMSDRFKSKFPSSVTWARHPWFEVTLYPEFFCGTGQASLLRTLLSIVPTLLDHQTSWTHFHSPLPFVPWNFVRNDKISVTQIVLLEA